LGDLDQGSLLLGLLLGLLIGLPVGYLIAKSVRQPLTLASRNESIIRDKGGRIIEVRRGA